MRMFQLDPRLQLCAEMVREGSALADVGTDHAYLPIWLLLHQKISRAIAIDVREGPLQTAKENVVRYQVEKQVRLSLSNGLCGISAKDADDIVIAGMGGELIAQILSEAPWTKDPEKRLILQPMTTAPELRKWLGEQGYAIEQEKCAVADGKPYSVMQVTYDPQQAWQLMKEELYPYIGTLAGNMPEEKEYISKVIHQLSNRLKGYVHTNDQSKTQQAERILWLLREKIGLQQTETMKEGCGEP